jgi:crotonobetainyl-CoA:carnitine CoA-transferase CaiB-like acyl-CoA transferase
MHRQKTGKGQYIDVGMFDAGLAVIENAITRYDMLAEISVNMGSRHPAACPHNVYKTKDGLIALIVIEDGGWKRMTEAMGKPELQKDPDIGKAVDRLNHRDRVDGILEEWTSKHSTVELIEILKKHHLAYGVVKNAKELIDDPHVVAREMVVPIDQPGYGKIRIPGNPIKFSEKGAEAKARGPAPAVGEHNKNVLCDLLGYSEKEFEVFQKDGVI